MSALAHPLEVRAPAAEPQVDYEIGTPAQLYDFPSPAPENPCSLEALAHFTLAHASAGARFWGRAASVALRRSFHNTPENGRPAPERMVAPLKKHQHEFLVSQPHPRSGIKSSEAATIVLLPGLSEIDRGSALRLHLAIANHPGFDTRRVVTKCTEGVSHDGQLLPLNTGHRRNSREMATDLLQVLPRVTNDGPTEICGTSWGSFLGVETVDQNLAANPKDQRNITRLTLLASAVIAREVDYASLGVERYFPPEMSDDEVRDRLTHDFFNHIPHDLYSMYLKHPEDLLECTEAVFSYLLQPHKALHRLSAIYGNFRNVQKGIEVEAIERIASTHQLWAIGGENDPLVRAQIPFWTAYEKRYPLHVRQKIIPGMGHLMTANAAGIAAELAAMEAA